MRRSGISFFVSSVRFQAVGSFRLVANLSVLTLVRYGASVLLGLLIKQVVGMEGVGLLAFVLV